MLLTEGCAISYAMTKNMIMVMGSHHVRLSMMGYIYMKDRVVQGHKYDLPVHPEIGQQKEPFY